MKQILKTFFSDWLTNKNLDVLMLSSSGLTFFLDIIEKYRGAVGFFAFFVLALIIRITKAKQDYRHSEEEHDMKMTKMKGK